MNLRDRLSLSPLAVEAFWWLLVAWLLIDILPGNLYLRLLPPKRAAAPPEPRNPVSLDPVAPTIAHVVDFLSRHLPVRSVCFHRSIAVDRMLRRRRISHIVHYGLMRENGALKAHVWVTSSGCGLIGLTDAAPYTEIAQFVDVSANSDIVDTMPPISAGRLEHRP